MLGVFGAGARFSLIFFELLIRKRSFCGHGWPGLDFHRFSIKFLLETDHFGALAGRGSIFIDFLLNSY